MMGYALMRTMFTGNVRDAMGLTTCTLLDIGITWDEPENSKTPLAQNIILSIIIIIIAGLMAIPLAIILSGL
jgi:hypothetical protein